VIAFIKIEDQNERHNILCSKLHNLTVHSHGTDVTHLFDALTLPSLKDLSISDLPEKYGPTIHWSDSDYQAFHRRSGFQLDSLSLKGTYHRRWLRCFDPRVR
jgi:hypothetical protein